LSLEAHIGNGIKAKLEAIEATQLLIDPDTQDFYFDEDLDTVCGTVEYVGTNEIFFEDSDFGAEFRRDVANWTWQAKVAYNTLVDSSSIFPALMTETHLGAVSSTDSRAAIVKLQQLSNISGPRQEGHGTALELTFDVSISRT